MDRFVPIGANRPEQLLRFDATPQRTPTWFARRRGKISGSKLSQILFCKTAKEAKLYREELLGLRDSEPLSEEALARCRWGTENEPNSIATLLQNIPDAWVFEVGFEVHDVQKWMGSSPDGVITWPSRYGNSLGVLECKCCTKRGPDNKTVPYKVMPYYYLMQVYWEMRCANLSFAVFTCWGELRSTAWHVPFVPEVWLLVYELVTDFLSGDLPWSLWQRKCSNFVAMARQHCASLEALHGERGWESIKLAA